LRLESQIDAEISLKLSVASAEIRRYRLSLWAKGLCLKRNFSMWQQIRKAILVLLVLAPVASTVAQDLSRADLRSLDGQVQEIKSDVLIIASELNNLEERLLYPSNTQMSVFVEIAPEEEFRLDAVQITINGELATHHIYSFKELEALQKGGVQRIYTGNITTGEHQIDVIISGKLKSGKDFSESGTFTFAKGIKPKALGVTLSDGGAIQVGDW
jgi:hypothetical protein